MDIPKYVRGARMKFYGSAFEVFSDIKKYLEENEIKSNDKGWAITIKKQRNIKLLRKYWKMCDLIGQEIGKDKEVISSSLLISIGYCVELPIVNEKGYKYVQPRSISFEKLNETEFQNIYEKANLMSSMIFDLSDNLNEQLNKLI